MLKRHVQEACSICAEECSIVNIPNLIPLGRLPCLNKPFVISEAFCQYKSIKTLLNYGGYLTTIPMGTTARQRRAGEGVERPPG